MDVSNRRRLGGGGYFIAGVFKIRRIFYRRACPRVCGWLAGYVFTNRFGEYSYTGEARLAPISTVQVYTDKATIQVNSSCSTTVQSKVHATHFMY